MLLVNNTVGIWSIPHYSLLYMCSLNLFWYIYIAADESGIRSVSGPNHWACVPYQRRDAFFRVPSTVCRLPDSWGTTQFRYECNSVRVWMVPFFVALFYWTKCIFLSPFLRTYNIILVLPCFPSYFGVPFAIILCRYGTDASITLANRMARNSQTLQLFIVHSESSWTECLCPNAFKLPICPRINAYGACVHQHVSVFNMRLCLPRSRALVRVPCLHEFVHPCFYLMHIAWRGGEGSNRFGIGCKEHLHIYHLQMTVYLLVPLIPHCLECLHHIAALACWKISP